MCAWAVRRKRTITPLQAKGDGEEPLSFLRSRPYFQLAHLLAESLHGVTGPCARYVMTTLAQGDLPKDAGILRAAAQHNRANVGVYASVLQGGKIQRGDSVRLM